MSAPVDVITIGESMVLFAADVPGPLALVSRFSKRLAGAETNVAIGLSRMGLRVSWISRVGNDSFGDYVTASVSKEGVDCTGVVVDGARSTGFMLKSRTLDGSDPLVEYHRRGSAASCLSMADFDEQRFASARHLHVTGISLALSPETRELVRHAMRYMRAAGRTVSFDPNLRPALWPDQARMISVINEFAGMADWVLPGLNEGQLLTGQMAPEDISRYYLQNGSACVVVKFGAKGAQYITAEASGMVAGVKVDSVVDTVGAGDGFAAGVLSARLEGLDWLEALARGNWIGARAVQSLGDMEGFPYKHEVVSYS